MFKIGDNLHIPVMISAEEAVALFEADRDEVPVDLSEEFDMVYQKVKASLFKSDSIEENEKEAIKALEKVKVLTQRQILPKDYLADLMQVIKADALPGYGIRFINRLVLKDADKLLKQIPVEYLARIIYAQNRVDKGEEALILTEELQ